MCIQETHVNHSGIQEQDGFWFVFSSEITNPLDGNAAREFAGVGFIISPEMTRFVHNFETLSSRIARLSTKCHGNPLHIFSVYAPHAGRPSGEKELFYHNLIAQIRKFSDAEVRLIYGDFLF
jgi:exonuclease III